MTVFPGSYAARPGRGILRRRPTRCESVSSSCDRRPDVYDFRSWQHCGGRRGVQRPRILLFITFPPLPRVFLIFFFSRLTCARVAGRDRFIVIRERRRRRAFDHDLCRAEVASTLLLLSCRTLSRTWTSPWPPVRHVLRFFFFFSLSPPAVFSDDTICIILI